MRFNLADRFDLAVADGVGDRIKRVANKAKYVPDANLFERLNQDIGHCL
jgi:hypothetical protein